MVLKQHNMLTAIESRENSYNLINHIVEKIEKNE